MNSIHREIVNAAGRLHRKMKWLRYCADTWRVRAYGLSELLKTSMAQNEKLISIQIEHKACECDRLRKELAEEKKRVSIYRRSSRVNRMRRKFYEKQTGIRLVSDKASGL